MSGGFIKRSALAGLASLLLASGALTEEWKFAIEEIPGSVMDAYAQEFKKRIEAATGGDVAVTVYSLGSLGAPTEVAEQTADGIIQLSNLSIGNLGTLVPESQILLMPYALPSDEAELNKILSTSPAIREGLAEAFESKGLKLGTLYSEGPMVWTTNKEFHKPEDLANVKVRVMVSPVLLAAYEKLGASPTPIDFGEVYGALQLGQIDAQVNPIPAIEDMKFYEVTNYLVWAGELDLITAVMASDDWYQSLPEDRKKFLDQTFAEMGDFMVPVVATFNAEKLEKIKEKKPGIKLIELSEEEREVFRERTKDTVNAVRGVVGEKGAELLQELSKEAGG